MDFVNAAAWIEHWEGRRNKTYIDTMGHPTVGVGFNLDANGAQAAITALGLDYAQVRAGTQLLTDPQIDTLLQQGINQVVSVATTPIPAFNSLPSNQQIVIVDMIFNLGLAGFSKFVQTIKAINAQDWQTASQQMQQSAWFSQVGNRAKADVDMMAGRITPADILGGS
ncbi:MAG: glycoside hydrolase family protein [Candidatus Korobacteraceae bacterium]